MTSSFPVSKNSRTPSRKKDGKIEWYSLREDSTFPSDLPLGYESTFPKRVNYEIQVTVQSTKQNKSSKIQPENKQIQTFYDFVGASETGSRAGGVGTGSSSGLGGAVNFSNHAFRRVSLAANACLAFSRSSCDDALNTYSSVFET